jgi:LPS-assembly lipoprotein
MSWCDPSRLASTARFWSSAVLLPLSLSLGGCFHPLYASVGGQLGVNLRSIAVDPVPEKLGHYLRDALLTNLNGTGQAIDPAYHLTLTTHERVQTALVDITTQRSQDGAVITDVDYKLTPVGGTAPIVSGTVTSAAVYDRSEQRFANIRAARDAEIRDARTLADLITTNLAAKLSDPDLIRPKKPAASAAVE